MELRKWFVATRPWSFTMTFVAVSFAAVLAYKDGAFGLPLYLITLVGLIIFHAATNMINDYFDVKHGVDRADVPTVRYRPHPLLAGDVSERGFITVTAALYAVVFGIAAYLTSIRGYLVMALTVTGFLFSIFYTSDPVVFKHRSFGEIAVFLVWGPLMVGGAYYVISGNPSLDPSIASIPIGMLVALVLLANNIRDIDYDGGAGIVTIVTKLGREGGLKLYRTLLISVYLFTVLLVGVGMLSPWSLLTLLTLPRAISIIRLFDRELPNTADSITAKLTLNYGLLLILGELVGAFNLI